MCAFFANGLYHTEVYVGMTLQAAGSSSSDTIDSAGVQCGLGILFSLSGDHDKAAASFESAISSRPDDSELWNRLGAALANGGRSEEAVRAYRRALRQSPGMVRPRYNLGVSCISLGEYSEACRHFLSALGFQQSSSPSSPSSNSLWSSLKLALGLAGRHDLLPLAEEKNAAAVMQAMGFTNQTDHE